jgi:hypothetical protein
MQIVIGHLSEKTYRHYKMDHPEVGNVGSTRLEVVPECCVVSRVSKILECWSLLKP